GDSVIVSANASVMPIHFTVNDEHHYLRAAAVALHGRADVVAHMEEQAAAGLWTYGVLDDVRELDDNWLPTDRAAKSRSSFAPIRPRSSACCGCTRALRRSPASAASASFRTRTPRSPGSIRSPDRRQRRSCGKPQQPIKIYG